MNRLPVPVVPAASAAILPSAEAAASRAAASAEAADSISMVFINFALY